MSRELIKMLSSHFHLKPIEEELLSKTMRQIGRKDRRAFFQLVKPKEREFKLFLKEKIALLGEAGQQEWVEITAASLLDKGGDPDMADSMVMDLVGRINVYKRLRERSENEGIKLKPMASFGGLSMVLVLVIIITGLVLYIINTL